MTWGCAFVLALTAVSGVVPAWAQSKGGAPVEQLELPMVNQALPGARLGILTNTAKGTVRIGRDTYTLPPDVILEDDKGNSLTWKDLVVFNGFDQVVKYWLGTGPTNNQITQMIVQFPR
jgi:hypothetical protein